jgi:hypothetical protein
MSRLLDPSIRAVRAKADRAEAFFAKMQAVRLVAELEQAALPAEDELAAVEDARLSRQPGCELGCESRGAPGCDQLEVDRPLLDARLRRGAKRRHRRGGGRDHVRGKHDASHPSRRAIDDA